jgi:hypothetical protein
VIPADQHRQAVGCRHGASGRVGPAVDLRFAEPAEEAIGGQRGDPQAALRARLQVLI